MTPLSKKAHLVASFVLASTTIFVCIDAASPQQKAVMSNTMGCVSGHLTAEQMHDARQTCDSTIVSVTALKAFGLMPN